MKRNMLMQKITLKVSQAGIIAYLVAYFIEYKLYFPLLLGIIIAPSFFAENYCIFDLLRMEKTQVIQQSRGPFCSQLFPL